MRFLYILYVILLLCACSHEVEINQTGEIKEIDCNSQYSCDTCIASSQCAWCISHRACRKNAAWECQGDEDHVSLTQGNYRSCPQLNEDSEEALKRRERKERKREASRRLDDQESSEGDEEEASPLKKRRSKGNIARDQQETKEELIKRAELALNNYGKDHPYETLSVPITASSGEIRKAYYRLSLLFHPDKNNGSEESNLAFKDIVAAFEIIGDPDKRSVFDELGNTSETFYSEAEYRAHGQKNEGNFYQGNPLITALTEKLWEKRVGSNNDVWIVEFYAPWVREKSLFIYFYIYLFIHFISFPF